MNEEEREFDIMRTYARAWQTEIVMYHLFGIPLWFPFSLRQAGFFMVGLAFTFVLSKMIPGMRHIPLLGDAFVVYGVYPFLIMKFFTQMTLDGKPPHMYIKDQINYLMENKRFNMYEPIQLEENIRFTSQIGYRTLKFISKIDYELLRRERK